MHNSTFNRSRFSRLNFFIAFLLLISFSASAQFYTKHYIAPAPWQYFSKSNEIVIATNSETPVSIKLYRSNGVLETTLSAVKGAPAIYRFQLLAKDLPMHALNTVISGAGLIVESAGPTSVNMRNVASDDNSGDNNDAYLKGNAALTSFGDAGLGVRFRVGYYRDGTLGSFSTFGDQRPIYSIMATVNNTSVKINNAIVTTLNAGQSYLFKAAIGTLVESSSPAVMNTAAAIDMPDGCGDSAYNQIPPESVLGTEYFIERGKGNNKAEQTTVVATKDDTHLVINTYSTSGAVVGTTNVTLATAGSFHTFNNGSLDTPFSASRVAADKRVVVYSGTAQSCEVDISTIAPVSECGGSNFIETAKFRNYGTGTLPYFGYILLRSQNDPVMVNGTNIETRSGIAARHQLGNTGWYVINFEDTQIGSPDVLSISCDTKMTVSIVQQGGGFSMAGFFSNFAAQPDEPTLTYISGGGCTNNTAELTTPPNFDPYQWYFNGTAISGANSSTYTATKTGNYTVASTLACGVQTQSKPVNVILCTDLGITKTVDNATPCIGTNVEFTVKVSNLGGNNVSGVSVNDLLPSGYTYVSSTPSVGVYDSSTGTWSIGDVDAQTSVTLKITATVKSSGNYTNTATLPASIDINTANNSASAAVNPNPVVTLVTNAFTACVSGDLTAASVTAGSSNNLTFSYWTNSAATSAVPNPTSVSGGNYYIKAVSAEGCSAVKSVVVTVNTAPGTPTITSRTSGATINNGSISCFGGSSVTLRATSSSGYLWSTGETTRDIVVTTDGTYSVKVLNSSNCISVSSSPVTVTLAPAPVASNQTFCSSENKKIGDLVATGSNIKWYSASSGGTALSSTQSLPTTAGNYNYYATQTLANNCESPRTSAIVITINNTSSAPTASPQTFCSADNKKISDLSPSGPTIKWYDTNTSTSALAGTTTLTSKTYYVSQTANSCGESARTAVLVTINNIPSAPTASSQTFCGTDSKTVNDLIATGTNLKWYNQLTGGTLYNGTETLASGSYYVSQSNSCGESTRTSVNVTVNNTAAPTASAQSFCLPDAKKVSNLVATGTSLKWYNASTGGTQYTGNETLSSNNYYVSQTLNGCESPRTLVVVTVTNATAPTASSLTFCSVDGKKVSDLTVTSGTNLKWYTASTGGTQYTGNEILSSNNYYVSQTINNCESTRTLVSVTVNPTPATPTINAGGSTTFCTGGNVVLTSTSGIGYLWSNGATTQSITVSNSGNYSVQVTNASGCYSESSTPVTVTVNNIPTAPSASSQTFCVVDGKKVSDLVATGSNLKWYDASSNGTLYIGTETLVDGIYYVSQTTNGCESSRTAVNVTVTPKPAKVITTATICSGDTYNWPANSTNYTATGTYTVSNNGCTADQELQLTVTPKPAKVITTATICSGDTYNWSVNSTNYTATGTYTVSNNGCTADQELQLTVTPKPAKVITTATICSGDTYNWSVNSTNYTATGTYTVSNNGCTADQELQLTVTPKPAKIITTAAICSGDTYNWPANSTNYTATGTYTVANNGCTADQELQLTVTPKPAKIITTAAICSGDTYNWSANSTNYTATGTYTVANNGCTADQELQLTVTPKPAKIITTATICSGDTYNWSVNSTNYTATGTYTVSNNGCTADQELQLTVTPKPTKVITTATICSGDTYNWPVNSANYTATGTYTVSNNGCTADQELQLTVTPKPAKVITTAAICSGDTYNWSVNSVNYTATGTYTVANNGCTADQELQLTVTPKPAKVITTVAICSGDTYNWSVNSTNYTATGTYTVSNNGCTADQELQLTVTPKPAKIITTATICSGDTYNWSVNSTNYTATGTYTVSNNGCTADQELQLTVTPKPAKIITTATICSGDTYNWSVNSVNYTATGTYTVSNNGCTADQELQLTVTPKPAKIITTATICFGDTYNWSVNSTNYTATGTYTVSNNGCTADQELQLTVTPKPAKIITTATICSGDTYNWSVNSTNYTATGTYMVSNNGCTADQELQLTVTPKPAKIITTATICSGDTYNWSVNSANYTATGTYTVSNNGCTADQELQLTVINIASPIVGLITQPTCTSATASVELSGLPAGSWTINPGNITGNTASTTITGLIAGNTYNYTVTDYLGCQSLASSNVTVPSYICAEDDTPSPINGAAGGTISTVFANDKINGSSFVSTDVIVSTSLLPAGIVFNSDGTITVAPNTVAGTHLITYTICMSANSSICDTAIVKIIIERPVIDAVTETTTAINSNNGGTTVSLTANDTLDGNPFAVGSGAGKVTFTLISTLPTGLTLNADQTITVAPGTASGSYEVEYSICDNDHTLNCDTVKSYVQVTGDVLVANADSPASVTTSNTAQTIITVVDNDTRNGQPLAASEVKITTTVADPSGYLVLNPTTGVVTLGANAPAGSYSLTYSICDKTNASNCSTATVSLTVKAPVVTPVLVPVIDAVTETTIAINSNNGGTTISLTANDTLDGNPFTVGTGAGKVTFTLISTLPTGLTLNSDQTLTVASGTASGSYEVEYSICDNDHALNCDTVKSYIIVTGDLLVLKDDLAGPIAGVNHPVNVINVLGNDTKNGLPITASDVNLSVTVADPTGYLSLNPDGTVVLKENAPAGNYGLTYQVCELNTTNCKTAEVKVTVVLPTMTVTANSYCSNDVPYVSYSVTPDNFTTNNLLTVKWIDSDNNVVATQTNLPLSGSILWPGAIVDGNGVGVDWPGWLLANGQWIEGADGFEKTRTGVTVEFSLNPTVSVVVNYPPATPQCNARPTFEIKANNDNAGPIDAKKGISTALNIFSNDRLNGNSFNQTAVVLSTVVANPNLILNADGSVDVKSGTSSGTYQLTYQICEASNLSNCSQAVVNVTVVNSEDPVPTPQIITKDDLQVSVDGVNGQLEFVNILDNDLWNGLPIDPTNVVISNTPKSPYFEFNADGTVNVKPNTPGGTYTLVYQVCEKTNSSNCSSSTLNVFVEVPNIAIIKTAVFNDENANGFANAGETISYKFKVTNTGNVALKGITITDPLPGVVVSGQAINLEVGESNESNFTAKYKITQSDIIAGKVSNQATALGKSARGVEAEDKSDDVSNTGDNPTVLDLDGCKVKVLNAFSPNGDLKNARFYIQGIECYPDNTVEIYNRWGVLVFDIDHYNNEDRVFVGFSGGRATIKESDGLPGGTYFYTLKYKDSDSNQHEQSGYLYLNK